MKQAKKPKYPMRLGEQYVEGYNDGLREGERYGLLRAARKTWLYHLTAGAFWKSVDHFRKWCRAEAAKLKGKR